MAKPKLYYHPGSFYSQKVLFALKEKGVNYDEHLVDLLGLNNYAPWYMKLNKKGQVPILQHGESIFADSKEITEYIDSFDGPALFPKAHEAEVKSLISEVDSIKIDILTYGSAIHPDLVTDVKMPKYFLNGARKKVNTEMAVGLLTRYKAQCTDDGELQAAYQAKLDKPLLTKPNFQKENVVKELNHADTVFEKLEQRLEKSSHGGVSWLFGETFTAADIALAVCVHRLYITGYAHKLWSTRPHIAAYRERLLAEKPVFVQVCVGMWPIMRAQLQLTLKKALPVLAIFAAIGVGYWYSKRGH